MESLPAYGLEGGLRSTQQGNASLRRTPLLFTSSHHFPREHTALGGTTLTKIKPAFSLRGKNISLLLHLNNLSKDTAWLFDAAGILYLILVLFPSSFLLLTLCGVFGTQSISLYFDLADMFLSLKEGQAGRGVFLYLNTCFTILVCISHCAEQDSLCRAQPM